MHMNGLSGISMEKNKILMVAVHSYIVETDFFKIHVSLLIYHTHTGYIYTLCFVSCLYKQNMFNPASANFKKTNRLL